MQARLIVSELPHHIVQSGHNRSAAFIEDSDYQGLSGQVLNLAKVIEIPMVINIRSEIFWLLGLLIFVGYCRPLINWGFWFSQGR